MTTSSLVPDHVDAPTLRAYLVDRLKALPNDAKRQIASQWPAGLPTLKQSDEHTLEQLEIIDRVVARAESDFGIGFIAPPWAPTAAIEDTNSPRGRVMAAFRKAFGVGDEEDEKLRHHLISQLTGGRTISTSGLKTDEVEAFIGWMAAAETGLAILHYDTDGHAYLTDVDGNRLPPLHEPAPAPADPEPVEQPTIETHATRPVYDWKGLANAHGITQAALLKEAKAIAVLLDAPAPKKIADLATGDPRIESQLLTWVNRSTAERATQSSAVPAAEASTEERAAGAGPVDPAAGEPPATNPPVAVEAPAAVDPPTAATEAPATPGSEAAVPQEEVPGSPSAPAPASADIAELAVALHEWATTLYSTVGKLAGATAKLIEATR